MPPKKPTSWNRVARWYDELLAAEGTYQKELILPNLMRLMDIRSSDVVLDLACGQGFFTREFASRAGRVEGVDSAEKLVRIAVKNAPTNATFHTAKADHLPFLKDKSVTKIAIVLALQNIENVAGTFRECARVLADDGSLFIVLNHPAFRVPKASGWGWDEKEKAQYRRIDAYLSESRAEIAMHPGAGEKSATTVSFHRPLQFYFKALAKAGFGVGVFEEWNSHKTSAPGPRAKAEDVARKEIPLFLCMGARKMKI